MTRSCPVNCGDMASLECAESRVRVTVVQRGGEGVHGRSQRPGHTMGCVHDEAGSWGSGGEPQDIGVTSVIASCPVNSVGTWHRSSALWQNLICSKARVWAASMQAPCIWHTFWHIHKCRWTAPVIRSMHTHTTPVHGPGALYAPASGRSTAPQPHLIMQASHGVPNPVRPGVRALVTALYHRDPNLWRRHL